MTPRVLNVHTVPPRGDTSKWTAEAKAPTAERFDERGALVLMAAAERGAMPERFGLGVGLSVAGERVRGAQLIVDDDLEARDPRALAELVDWGADRPLVTSRAPLAVPVVTRTAFCHPKDGLLYARAYRGGDWLLTGDEGRSLGLLAERPPNGRQWPRSQGWFAGGVTLGLPGCGHYGTRTDAKGRQRWGWQALLHTPPLRAKALGDHGLLAQWARAGWGGRSPDGEPAGHWERGPDGVLRPFLGRLVDLIGPAFALDGKDTGDLGQHLAAWGLPAHVVPTSVFVSPESAENLLDAALSVHRLAVLLDDELARWLGGSVGLGELVSGGSLARLLWTRTGARPPISKFATPDDDALCAYAAGLHGGWCE